MLSTRVAQSLNHQLHGSACSTAVQIRAAFACAVVLVLGHISHEKEWNHSLIYSGLGRGCSDKIKPHAAQVHGSGLQKATSQICKSIAST
jgi:hypothetical protein